MLQLTDPQNTDAETKEITDSILTTAAAAKTDPRFVLAIIMQESNGCVRVNGTVSADPSVFNPGVMQSFKGSGTCNVQNNQEVNPCGIDKVSQMLVDGVQGVQQKDGTLGGGLVQHLTDVGGDATGQTYYKAAREYNSGAVAKSGVLEDAGQANSTVKAGVPCYAR
jgi:hypothetical protein